MMVWYGGCRGHEVNSVDLAAGHKHHLDNALEQPKASVV